MQQLPAPPWEMFGDLGVVPGDSRLCGGERAQWECDTIEFAI